MAAVVEGRLPASGWRAAATADGARRSGGTPSSRRSLLADIAAVSSDGKGAASWLPASVTVGGSKQSGFTPVENRIIDGMNAPAGEFGFMVALLQYGSFICGGTLLDATSVLTAAHCVVDTGAVSNPSTLTAYLQDGSQNYQGFDIAAIYVQPEYDPNKIPQDNQDQTFDGALHDFAVLKLARPVSNPTTITLGTPDLQLPANGQQALEVVGWGVTETGQGSPTLKYGYVYYLPTQCPPDYQDELCAGASGENTCNGDSGGPLLVRNASGAAIQVGITSHGPQCPSSDPSQAYGYYTDVRAYVQQIQAFASEAAPPSAAPTTPGSAPVPLDSPGNAGASPLPAAQSPGASGQASDTCVGSITHYLQSTQLQVPGGSSVTQSSVQNAASEEECCQLCYYEQTCAAWTFTPQSFFCGGGPCCFFFQPGNVQFVVAPGYTSGYWSSSS